MHDFRQGVSMLCEACALLGIITERRSQKQPCNGRLQVQKKGGHSRASICSVLQHGEDPAETEGGPQRGELTDDREHLLLG